MLYTTPDLWKATAQSMLPSQVFWILISTLKGLFALIYIVGCSIVHFFCGDSSFLKVSRYFTGDEFTYLQVRDDLENTTKETDIFNGIETAVPDNGKPSCLTNVIPINTPKVVPFLIIKPLFKL
ncbi:hypothetical protein [Peribacillus simplex]|uniref:hypothetical protein n=1 Tax=Peribacillus simplex TaxID=1478 RepID=UPI0016290C84|nr:hypothetical protein [Peribacillus simplex]